MEDEEEEPNSQLENDIVAMGLGVLRIIEEVEESLQPQQQQPVKEHLETSATTTTTTTTMPIATAEPMESVSKLDQTITTTSNEPSSQKEEPGDDGAMQITEDEPQEVEVKKAKPTTPKPKAACQCHGAPIPLIQYLCTRYHCTPRELQVHFNNVQRRRAIIQHLRRCVQLRTNHMQPAYRNFPVQCNDLTTQSAADCHAFGGYLDIKVGVFLHFH